MILSHHLHQLYYILLLPCGYVLFINYTIPLMQYNQSIHIYCSTVCIILCIGSWIYCINCNAGKVTSNKQINKITQLYHTHIAQQNISYCTICNINKTYRIHHCKRCNQCIYKFDHHCLWINNCIGVYNIRWFIVFLAQHIITLLYSIYIHYHVVQHIIDKNKLFDVQWLLTDGSVVQSGYRAVNHYLVTRHTIIYVLSILCMVSCIILILLLIQYSIFILHNDTSYDRYKRNEAYDTAIRHHKPSSDHNKYKYLLMNPHDIDYSNNIIQCINPPKF